VTPIAAVVNDAVRRTPDWLDETVRRVKPAGADRTVFETQWLERHFDRIGGEDPEPLRLPLPADAVRPPGARRRATNYSWS
jgi:hypothetical protein